MNDIDTLLVHPEVRTDPRLRELLLVLTLPTGLSSAGFPYLERPAWERLRDWSPMLFAEGHALWLAGQRLEQLAASTPLEPVLTPSLRVLKQILRTAAVTAPPDLWLLRQVLGGLAQVGLSEQIAAGKVIHADQMRGLLADELNIDLQLLLARGYLTPADGGLRLASNPTAARVFREIGPRPVDHPVDASVLWTELFAGRAMERMIARIEPLVATPPPAPAPHTAPAWIATPEDIAIGSVLVPVVLGLRAANRIPEALQRGRLDAGWLCDAPDITEHLMPWLRAAGVIEPDDALTTLGRRVLERGPGPFGIIETYHPFLVDLPALWADGRGRVRVRRAANIAASLDANRETFRRANDSLDRLCMDTGFRYNVFVEHALGYGEATRQRWQRAKDAPLVYVGADLESEAIAAAKLEQKAGHLPPGMMFVGGADIADPTSLFRALRIAGHATRGAVMLVGNGFHEVRNAHEERLEAVFRAYERAGVVLIFTEASALSTEDLLNTAWNTYHAGFRYVHARSGQGLRPASPAPEPRVGEPLPPSWTTVAARAGYVRAARYCTRSRTIYPYPPVDGHNPSISENHVLLPRRIAQRHGFPLETGARHG